MEQDRLYRDLSWTWPIISPKEEYVAEAEEIAAAIAGHSRIRVRTLLNLGCGGGHIDWALKRRYSITGVDLSREMLKLAAALNPECRYLPGDMRSVRLEETFDAVLAHDAIAHLAAEDGLRACFDTAFANLKPGGVFITFAEYTRERFMNTTTTVTTHSRGNIEITLVENYYDPDPEDTALESVMIYLIRREGKLELEIDRMVVGLFPTAAWAALLKQAGFEVNQMEFVAGQCPMFVCVKPGRGL